MSVPFKKRLQSYIPKSLRDLFRSIEFRQSTERELKNLTLKENDFASDSFDLPPSQHSTKEYIATEINSAVTGLLDYKGGYDAATNTPNLDSSPPAGTIFKGDFYTVDNGGTFYTRQVDPGDGLIAEVDDPSQESDWTVVVGSSGSIYTIDGALSGNRTVTMDGNNLAFNYTSGNPSISMGKVTIAPNGATGALSEPVLNISGKIQFPYLGHQGQGLTWDSYNTVLTGYGFSFYGGGGFSHNSGFSVIGPNMNYNSGAALNSRLGVIGKSTTSTTDYAFRVQQSDNTDMFTVRDDGAFTLGRAASNASDSNVVIGEQASAPSVFGTVVGSSTSIANAGASYATIIGHGSTTSSAQNLAVGANCVVGFKGTSVGYGASGSGNYAINLGHDADGSADRSVTINASSGTAAPSKEFEFGVYMTGATTPDFRVIGDEGMVPPSITTTTRDAIASPVTGSTIYNTTDNKLQFYDGTSWDNISSNIYTADGTIGASRVATITDFPKFSGDQGNPIGLEIENIKSSASAHSTQGAQLKLTARAGASSTISFYNGLGGGSSAPAMVIDSPAGIKYRAGTTYSSYHHGFSGSTWTVGMTSSPLNASSPKQEMLLGGGGSNGSFYTTKIAGSSDYLYMFMSPGTAARHIALGEYTNSTTTYKDFLRINSTGDIGINQDTPTAKLHVTGSGASSTTTSFLVENSDGDDILNVRDDRQVQIGTLTADTETFIVNGTTRFKNQVTVDTSTSSTAFRIQQGGAYTVTMGRTAGSTGFLNVNSNNFTRFTVVAGSGVAIAPNGTASNAASAALTIDSTTKGMLPPRMTNTQRDAISSPATGLTLYSTTDSELQFYNGSAWTSAGGGSSSPWTVSGNDIYYNTGAVSVGTTTPDASAAVQVDSTTQGFLPPRMTTAQRTAISSPAEGLMVFDTDLKQWMGYDSTQWVVIG